MEIPGDVPAAERGRGRDRDRGRDRLFPASLTLFLTLPATQPGSQTHPGFGKCFGASSILSLAAFSGRGSSTAAVMEAGQIYKFQFNHTPGHKLSGNNSIFVPQALSAAEEAVVRGFCSAGIWGEAEDQKCSEGSFLCLQKGSGFAN